MFQIMLLFKEHSISVKYPYLYYIKRINNVNIKLKIIGEQRDKWCKYLMKKDMLTKRDFDNIIKDIKRNKTMMKIDEAQKQMRTSNDIKRSNVAEILHLIRRSGIISKGKITSNTELSQVTVYKIVNELVDRGICIETGGQVSTGGRNAAQFKINGRYGAIIGVNVFRHQIMTVVYSFTLEQLYISRVENELTELSPSLAVIKSEIRKALSALPDWHFLGIGVSIPGRSTRDGVVAQIPGFDVWNHLPLADILQQTFGLPVHVDNDNNALAVASKYNGLSENFSDYVYIQICEGIGIGVVIDEQLFRGRYGCGCELGHTSIMFNGPLCSCGNRGCLETFLSDEHMLSCIAIKCAVAGQRAPQTIAEAIEQARADEHSMAAHAFEEAVQYIVVAIEHVFRIFDTQAVILRCAWLSAFPDLFGQVVDNVFHDFPWIRRDRYFILNDDSAGTLESAAACLFLDHFHMRGDDCQEM